MGGIAAASVCAVRSESAARFVVTTVPYRHVAREALLHTVIGDHPRPAVWSIAWGWPTVVVWDGACEIPRPREQPTIIDLFAHCQHL